MRPLLAALLFFGCGDDVAPLDAAVDAIDAAMDADDAGVAELAALARAPAYADVDATIRLDASGSTGAETFAWDLGDGRRIDPSSSTTADASWPAPGRYSVVLTVTGPAGTRTDGVVVSVTRPPAHVRSQSSTVALLPDGRIAAINADAATVSVFTTDPPALESRITIADEPRTVTPWQRDDTTWLVIPCRSADLVAFVRGSERFDVPVRHASLPFGAARLGNAVYVTLQGTGEVVEIRWDAAAPEITRTFSVLDDARGIAATPDGRLAVTRWRSPDTNAEIALLDPATGAVESLALAFDPQESNDSESGGLPSYLEQALFSPNGVDVAIPSTQANIGEGTFNSDRPLTFETSVRGIVSWLRRDGASWSEDFEGRRLFDNRGFAAAGVFTSRGDYLFLATRGHRAIERIDTLTAEQSGTILGTGYAPDGVALSADDRLLFVNASLSRALQVYDVTSFDALPTPIAELPLVDEEPLDPTILRGKQLFNDSFDPRLARDGYIACAHCHLDGDSDHRVWDFTDRGEGLRRTPPLLGRTDDLPLHWSGNFDEVQDFENDIRGPFGGRGLLEESDWTATQDTLGERKTGRSEDLDALAAYVDSLVDHLPSPDRNPDGSLSDTAERGQAIFASAGCPTCHSGDDLTDSGFESPGVPRLHDVGTLGAGSGNRLGGPLPGLDTPTLHGLWHQPRYLHDGSASSLQEVLTTRNASDAHGTTSTLSPAQIDDLVAYLRSLDGRID